MTWLPLFYKRAIRYYRMGRDFFQGFFVASFFQLLIEYLGGEDAVIKRLERLPNIEELAKPNWLERILCCCCSSSEPDPNPALKVYLSLKRGTMQFTLIIPTMAIIIMILDWQDYYNSGDFDPAKSYLWLTIIKLVSAVWSMRSLKSFMNIMEDTLDKIPNVQARQKLYCIQGIILGLLVQGILIAIIFAIASPDNLTFDTDDINNFITVAEMTFVSFAHSIYFSHKEIGDGKKHVKYSFGKAALDALVFFDYFGELYYLFSKRPTKRYLKKLNTTYGTGFGEDGRLYDENGEQVGEEEEEEIVKEEINQEYQDPSTSEKLPQGP